MSNGICKNCGGDYGIHHYRTLQCPIGGQECSINQKQEYMETTYREDFDDLEDQVVELRKRIVSLESQVKALLEAAPSAGIKKP